jgi:hypothetical protein
MFIDEPFYSQLALVKTWAFITHLTFPRDVDVAERPKIIRKVITAFCKAARKQHCRLRYAVKREGDDHELLQHVHYQLLMDGSTLLRKWNKPTLVSIFNQCWQSVVGGGNITCRIDIYDPKQETVEGEERGLTYFTKRQMKLNSRGQRVEVPYDISLSEALKGHLARLSVKRDKKAERRRQKNAGKSSLPWGKCGGSSLPPTLG